MTWLVFFRVFGTTVEEDYEDSDQQDATQQDDLDPLSGKSCVGSDVRAIIFQFKSGSI